MAFRLQDEAKQLKGLFRDLVSLQLKYEMRDDMLTLKQAVMDFIFSVKTNCKDHLIK